MGKQKVTLSIDKEVYKHFKQYCEENAIMLSKKIELWMSEEMKHFRDTRGKRLCVKKELEGGRQ